MAEALFGAVEADVVAVEGDSVWRAKTPGLKSNDATARWIAGIEQASWIADTLEAPLTRDLPGVKGPGGVRFCALAPIRMEDGRHLGVIRVFDVRPRAYDAGLAARLEDLAASLASECDRQLDGQMRRVRELFDQAPGLMAISRGSDHIPQMVNAAFVNFIGDRDVVGRPLSESVPEIWAGFEAVLNHVYERGRPHVGRGVKMHVQRTADGPADVVYADFVLQPLREANGSVGGIFFQGHEVTNRLAANELRGSQAQLEEALSATQSIIDHSHDVICTLDAEGLFKQVSKHAERVWGYSPEELIGRRYVDLLHPDDVAASGEVRRKILAGNPTTAYTNRCLHRDGTIVPVMWSSVWSEAHQTMYVVARDMREHVAAEEKLRQAQKMEAVGRLTGGVAHDFNNLLTVIIGSAETLTDALGDRPDLRPVAELALEAAERGAELVSRLLIFARNQPLAPQSLDCRKMLDAILPILRGTIGEAIEIAMVAEEDDLRCLADRTQLTSALLNLCINARDAMPTGGRLTIKVARAAAQTGETHADRWEGAEVVWSVIDNGEGMTPETAEKALEPFFTTKPVGQGTGLGLSMVYGFVTQSSGRVEIASVVGEGTTIRLYLPETAQDEDVVAPRASGRAAPPKGHILLVEDDHLLRAQVRRQLLELGYRVTDSPNGRHALEQFSSTPDFDLLLTDVVMPGMNGRQLAEHARLLTPGLRVIFTSGHTEDELLRSGRFDETTQFLPKPYRRGQLASALLQAFQNV
ncbi:MAG TPA: PAS domain S-box protein [Caulobacteraceae bacterium]|nr:PAS domain S-box protein [Caulobacteraceae bacterium]